jgi:radical SAM protein with 4Fe4S-binding SPASM domain
MELEVNFDREDRYSLSNNWILRCDTKMLPGKKYALFNILNGVKYYLGTQNYIILEIFRTNYLSSNSVALFLSNNNLGFDSGIIFERIKHYVTQGVLDKSNTSLQISDTNISQEPITIKSNVPTCSSPFGIELHLTKACNLTCKHCFVDAKKKLPNELNADEWKNVFSDLISNNVTGVVISGGEPLVHPEAKEIFRFLQKSRLRVDLLTNGIKVDSEFASILSSKKFTTHVSLDGVDSETHDYLRGKKCFNKVIDGMHQLNQCNATFNTSTTLFKKNISQVRGIVELAMALGATGVNFGNMDSIGRAKQIKDMALTNEEMKTFNTTVEKLKMEYETQISISYLNYETPELTSSKNLPSYDTGIYCSAGTTWMAIRSDGEVFPCVYGFNYDKYKMGSLKEQKFSVIWGSGNWSTFRGEIKLNSLSACSQCEKKSICKVKTCRLRALYGSGDFFGPPPGCSMAFVEERGKTPSPKTTANM